MAVSILLLACCYQESSRPGASTTITLVVSVGPSALPSVTSLATVSNESGRTLANNTIGDPTVVSAR